VALGAVHVRGALSGAGAVQTAAIESRVRDGRVVAIRAYLDRDAALEAAGLRQ
jgi:ketosteroid isomerase-like protein